MTRTASFLVAMLALIAAACGTPKSVDWTAPPSIAVSAPYAPPAIQRFALANGIRVLLVENHRLPLVAIAAVNLAAGSRADSATPGIAALTADLLVAGAAERDRETFALAVERAGAKLDVDIATDAATLQLQVLPDHLGDGLGLLADALRHPSFSGDELERARRERLRLIDEHRDRARTLAAQTFDAMAFGDHPYAHPAEGESGAVARVDAAAVRAFHAWAYGPGATAIVVAGDVDRAQLERALVFALGDWRGTATLPAAIPLPAAPAPRLEIVDRPGSPEAVIVAGGHGQAPDAPDRVAAELANAAFGGSARSRLDRRLHDELGFTLAASSSFWRGASGGTWAIVTTVRPDKARDTIGELRAQIAAARAAPMTAAELAAAATQLARALPLNFATDVATVRTLARMVVQDLPDDYFRRFAGRLALVTPETARASIARIWTDPVIVVVGDRAAMALP